MVSSTSVLDSSTLLLVGTSKWVAQLAATLERRTGATVTRVQTGAQAIEVVRKRMSDCVISEYTVEETTGLELLREIRNQTTALPVLLGTAAGSEAIASEAIEAGVTDYIALTEPVEEIDELIERIERAVRSAQRSATQRERARQFDAV